MELAAWSLLLVFVCLQPPRTISYPREYTVINEDCPGAEWNIMCRDCCEYEQIQCICPGGKEKVGYTIPCCRNEENECDSCLIHPGCTIFDNCKTCHNGSWGGRLDAFYIKGSYCAECRRGWYGGDCMRCGEVIQASKGEILMEGYPINAHCEWSIQVKPGFIIELRFAMLSVEFDYMCQYDYIEIRDGDTVDARIMKRFCGNDRHPPIRSTGNFMHILFKSDGSKNFDGFYAHFAEVTACSSSPCFHDGTCILDKVNAYSCACLAGYTGKNCESLVEDQECTDPGGPLNGYRKVVEDSGLSSGRFAKTGTVVMFFCNNSYILSGDSHRTCLAEGTWSGKQPICTKACKEPKISDLVRQKVLPLQVQSRETPLHVLYSETFSKHKQDIFPTKRPGLPPGELPAGYHHLHTQLQYNCLSPFYQRLGSSRRTCLKTGKWSGRAPSCIPICGKIDNFTLSTVMQTRWPWQAAIYRKTNGVKDPTQRKGSWFLICSGALLNERTVVVAAHCMTDLGKTTVIKTAEMKVVLGKFYRDDAREEKSLQNLRISAILVHPNYDPILLDSDIALIKLLDKAKMSARVQPVCLATALDLNSSAEDTHIIITGWKILMGAQDPSYKNDTVRAGAVHVVDSLACEQQYEDNGISVSVTDTMFCAQQILDVASNICPSETGGIAVMPLSSTPEQDAKWYLKGLVSWGYDKTCSNKLYSGYTKVSPFQDWITKNLK
ncbi:inactive serine protease PAMR1 isoform X2 [Ambystoma mexicanum]|uniref:inactive serine protease PAMR1 isoform X2 n=1 Tax=Ambystoma mexicanum TaxID=8296 RepID=UPI0037E9618F